MNNSDERIHNLLKHDPVATAEKIVGSEGDPKDVASIGLLLHQCKSKILKEQLIEQGDVFFGCPLSYYLEVLIREGFEKVYEESFQNTSKGFEGHEESLYMFIHPEKAITVIFDTFLRGINSSKMSYCVEPLFKEKDYINPSGLMSSGGFHRNEDNYVDYIYGYHDGREAILHHIKAWETWGTFMNPWPEENDGVQLTKWNDYPENWNEYEYKELRLKEKERYNKLPDSVKLILNIK